jgi:hypothetical protein
MRRDAVEDFERHPHEALARRRAERRLLFGRRVVALDIHVAA